MEYHKIINLLDNATDRPSKFRTKIWGKTNDDTRENYNLDIQIKCKTALLKSILFDYSDTYIIVKENTTASQKSQKRNK